MACVVFDPRDPETIYAGASGGIYRWNERTARWELLTEGLDPQKSEASIRTLVFDPFHTDTLYACTGRGIFVRTLR